MGSFSFGFDGGTIFGSSDSFCSFLVMCSGNAGTFVCGDGFGLLGEVFFFEFGSVFFFFGASPDGEGFSMFFFGVPLSRFIEGKRTD